MTTTVLPEDWRPEAIPTRRIRWKATYRLVPSRYPPIDLFERVAPAEDWEALIRLEGLTNPRLRDEAGNISLVPKERRVSGPGASIAMAPFTHCSRERPSRFSDGSYGVYYAGRSFRTALLEVAFHMARFHGATNDPPNIGKYRCYTAAVDAHLHDITGAGFELLLRADVSAWSAPQAAARTLRDAGSDGILCPSVRDQGGTCIAAFWPNVMAIPKQERHVDLKWEGRRISAWFDARLNGGRRCR